MSHLNASGSRIFAEFKKKTVGKPTAEFREETHTKYVCVAGYMMGEIFLVNPAVPFFLTDEASFFTFW